MGLQRRDLCSGYLLLYPHFGHLNSVHSDLTKSHQAFFVALSNLRAIPPAFTGKNMRRYQAGLHFA